MLTDKVKVEAFLNKYFRICGNYTISDNGVIDVNGTIDLIYKKFNEDGFTEIPIQFGHISGDFEFEKSNITSLKGFPHTVDGFFSINNSKKLNSLEFTPKCKFLLCYDCEKLESLNNLNCYKFYGNNLNLKRFGTNFNAKVLKFIHFPTPTADEMRHLIALNIRLSTEKEEPWITLIKNYCNHKDIFRTAQEFEELYNEPWVKPEDKIEIINSDLTIGL